MHHEPHLQCRESPGAKGSRAQAASRLGTGRKGSPAVDLQPGQELVLADVEGPGIIRHLWITCNAITEANPFVYRNLVLKMYWDDATEPSVVAPLGDFFCCGGAVSSRVESLPIVVAPNSGFNAFIAMPFRTRARIVIESQHPDTVKGFFYQVDCTIGDEVSDDMGYFHAQWRRSNGDAGKGNDHVVLDTVRGRGVYLGSFFSVTSLERYWWGEGEIKFFTDGDQQWPSLTSTGLEDYVGGSWAFQDGSRRTPSPFPAHTPVTPSASRASPRRRPPSSQLRAGHAAAVRHVPLAHARPDPLRRRLRVTQQMIGDWDNGLFERNDDIASVATGTSITRPVSTGRSALPRTADHADRPGASGCNEPWPPVTAVRPSHGMCCVSTKPRPLGNISATPRIGPL
ncbi:glycoside hydrolase family 172 protein [Brachybacterium sacelli]|uniref:glycoside hydrolase family 172 protein n=1 Tax=Brachybacterium sacelli TaxID=173364 RepID=UPI00360A82D8